MRVAQPGRGRQVQEPVQFTVEWLYRLRGQDHGLIWALDDLAQHPGLVRTRYQECDVACGSVARTFFKSVYPLQVAQRDLFDSLFACDLAVSQGDQGVPERGAAHRKPDESWHAGGIV